MPMALSTLSCVKFSLNFGWGDSFLTLVYQQKVHPQIFALEVGTKQGVNKANNGKNKELRWRAPHHPRLNPTG